MPAPRRAYAHAPTSDVAAAPPSRRAAEDRVSTYSSRELRVLIASAGLDADGCLIGVGGEVANAGNPRDISQMDASPRRQEDSGLEKSEESDAACDRIGTLDPRADDLQSPAVRGDMKKGEGAGGGIGGVGVGNGAGREGVGVEAATTEGAHGMMRQGDKGTSRCHARAARQEQKRARGAPGSARSGDGIAVRPRPAGDEVVVQQYVLPPMLIGKRKFDLRCFCLVACVEPTLPHWRYSPISVSDWIPPLHLTPPGQSHRNSAPDWVTG